MSLDLFLRVVCIVLILGIIREMYLTHKLPDDPPIIPKEDLSEDIETRMMRFSRTVDLVEELNKPVDLSDLHPPVESFKSPKLSRNSLKRPGSYTNKRSKNGSKNKKR